jgi:predicted phosphodiesterase
MKIAFLSDIHANQEALEAVLIHADRLNVDRFCFLGDAVGYGPDPHVPLLWLKYYVQDGDWVLGNHDAFFANLFPGVGISRTADQALSLNHYYLSDPENNEANTFWQEKFTPQRMNPVCHCLDGVNYWLVHSSQHDHVGLMRYLYAWQVDIFLPEEFAKLSQLSLASGKPCVQAYGHTHVPTLVYGLQGEDGFGFSPERIFPGRAYPLGEKLAIFNPGSVGFPRDLCNQASYAVVDTEMHMITFQRVAYDWQATAVKLARCDYPSALRERLRFADVDSTTPQDWREHYLKVVGSL